MEEEMEKRAGNQGSNSKIERLDREVNPIFRQFLNINDANSRSKAGKKSKKTAQKILPELFDFFLAAFEGLDHQDHAYKCNENSEDVPFYYSLFVYEEAEYRNEQRVHEDVYWKAVYRST